MNMSMKNKLSFKSTRATMKIAILFLAIMLSVVFTGEAGTKKTTEHEVTVPLRFDYYYTYDMVVDALKKLNKAYPALTKLDLLGKSEEGRAIYCMTVNNPKTGKELDKPGIYVDGNIHGNEIQAGEVALYLLDYLLGNYGKNKVITELVDKKCFYVIPVVNVDGRYHFMTDGNHSSSNRGLRRPHDDDNDGLLDEDFPDDLDGDGNICRMRIRDPLGDYKTDPDDPRLMVRVKPGEKGEWTMLGSEGIDNDGDGRINEDSEGYVDGNRNWGYNWQPMYVQAGSGDYPFSGTGIKAIAQFIRKRTNICMAWAFHNVGGMFLRGPSSKAEGAYHPNDVAVYDILGKQSERIVPGYRYMIGWKDLYTTYGDFMDWMVKNNGCYGFVGELFVPDQESFKTLKESEEKDESGGFGFFGGSNKRNLERLKYNDHLTQGELHKPWKAFKHPTYGNIEIGGWVKMSNRLPAPFMLKDLVHRNASAVIYSAKQTPEVTMEVFGKKKVAGNLYRIRVRLLNSKAMPSMTYHSQIKRLYPKDMLKVSGQGIKVVAGGMLTDKYTDKVSYKEHRPEVQFMFVPGHGTVEYQFLVTGTGAVQIRYESRHAGNISKTIKLQ